MITAVDAGILEVFHTRRRGYFPDENTFKSQLVYRIHRDGTATIYKNRFTNDMGHVTGERLENLKSRAIDRVRRLREHS